MRIDPEKTICIAVDYQERLLPAIAEKDALMKKSVFLIKCLKELGIPVIMTTQYAKGLGANDPEIAELIGEENCFDKTTFSIYGQPEVAEYIKNSGCRNVILCGTEAHICLLQSLIDIQEAGYQTVFVTDCVSSRKLPDKDAAVLRADEEGALCTTAEALVYELMVSAKNPHFKAISNLVKAQ